MKNNLLILILIILSFSIRVYGLNWDSGYHLHPDERMITMVAERIRMPSKVSDFLSSESPLNPKFFAYGSFPVYLLKFSGSLLSIINPKFASYDYLNLIGRFFSAVFDTGTIFLIYLLGKRLLNKKVGLLAASFYGLSVFPIQASHFYAVDVMLTFFILLTLYFVVCLIIDKDKRAFSNMALAFGFALATKVSAVLLVVPIGLGIFFYFLQEQGKLFSKTLKFFFILAVVFLFSLITFVLLEPYAVIDFQTFWRQTQEQSRMTKDAFAFPYTLQYVNTTPYIYHIKNMVNWGMGIPLGIMSIAAILFFSFISLKKLLKRDTENNLSLYYLTIPLSFFWVYFLIVGRFAIKFMRYFLPLYPIFIIFSVFFLLQKKSKLANYFSITVVILIIIWNLIYSFSFLSIYSKPTTRILATDWINNNIPTGSTIAREHWDDGLPIFGGEKYKFEEFKLYERDTEEKWKELDEQLKRTEYILIASNRLYVPLSKLTNCDKLPQGRCYPKTARYYNKLFKEELGFKKAVEFSSYPIIPFFNIPIIDDNADESFTVYDHPKILIYKKSK